MTETKKRESESLPLNSKSKEFPWGTKGELNRVGEKLRAGENGLTAQEARILDNLARVSFPRHECIASR
jgi:hypothetical protein